MVTQLGKILPQRGKKTHLHLIHSFLLRLLILVVVKLVAELLQILDPHKPHTPHHKTATASTQSTKHTTKKRGTARGLDTSSKHSCQMPPEGVGRDRRKRPSARGRGGIAQSPSPRTLSCVRRRFNCSSRFFFKFSVSSAPLDAIATRQTATQGRRKVTPDIVPNPNWTLFAASDAQVEFSD